MTKKFSVSMSPDVYQIVVDDSKRFGLSVSGYLSQLAVQKNIEINATRLTKALSDEQLQTMIKALTQTGAV